MRKDTRPLALLFLVSAVAAIGANAATFAATAASSGDTSYPARGSSNRERGATGVVDPADAHLCGREVAACADDAGCGGCLAMVTGRDELNTAELPGCGGDGGGCSGVGIWDAACAGLFLEGGSPATRCETVGDTVCRAITAVARGNEGVEGGSLSESQRTESCVGNGVVQALLACRVQAAGCGPEDAPCITPENRRQGGVSLSAGGSTDSNNTRPAPRPPSEDLENAGGRGARDVAAAGAAVATGAAGAVGVTPDAEGFGSEWVTSYHRRLSNCDGIERSGVCCGGTCGECGGLGCSDRGNGGGDCCRQNILGSGIMCSETGGTPPCIVDGMDRTARGGHCYCLMLLRVPRFHTASHQSQRHSMFAARRSGAGYIVLSASEINAASPATRRSRNPSRNGHQPMSA